MSIKAVGLSVTIHGLDADPKAPHFLKGWIEAAVKDALLGNERDLFRFRNEFDSDIEVEIDFIAGPKD